MTGCPSEDELVQMVEGGLDAAALGAIEAHVDTCEACAEVLAGLGALARGSGGASGSGGAAGRGRAAGSGEAAGLDEVAGPGAPGGRGGPGGRTVGRYQLRRRIAAGGMGEVWAAWDPQLRREIAIKLVRPERADDGRERTRLLREARALARLGHPNVLAVHDVGEGEIDGEIFIATELVAGETLASRGAGASWRELARLYAQAARGLAAAHAAGLVHRDVKPANLLLGADGRVRVADFGLAVRSIAAAGTVRTEQPTEEVSLTATGFVAGTPAYMAPEQRSGQPADARADQYALCVSLAEALAGRRPPLDVDPAGLIELVAARRGRAPDLDALCGALARGLARDPRKRFPDTGALAEELERIAAGGSRELASAETMAAADPPPPSPASGSRRRDPSSAPRPPSDPAHRASGAAASSGLRPGSDGGSGPRSGRAASGGREPVPADASDARSGGRAAASGPRSGGRAAAGTGPRAGRDAASGPRSGGRAAAGPRSSGQTRADGPRSRARAALGRRLAPFAIAGVAAAAGIAAVLLGARAFSRKPARPGAPADSLRVEPIAPGPGSGASPPASLDGSAAPAPAILGGSGGGSGAPPPAGVPLDLPPDPAPRAPANKTVALAPPAAPFADLSGFTADIQRALRQHDAAGCKRLVAGLPGNVHPSMRFSVETFAAYCDMIGGDCAGGIARLDRAQTAQGLRPQGAAYADQFCPVEGALEARLQRLRTQISAHASGSAQEPAWCAALVAPAQRAVAEATTGTQRGIAAWSLLQLATCVGGAGRCDEARALWSAASAADDSIKSRPPDLGPRCAAASAQLAATEAYADPTALLQALGAAIRGHDARACRQFLAAPIPHVHPGHQYSIELLLAHCEMLSGDCAAGAARLARIGPSPSGAQVSAATRTAWLRSQESTYCPITGDLDARLARLWSQIDGFTTAGGGGNVAWCDTLLAPARTLAGEVTTPVQRKRAATSLQRLGACVAGAGRCDEGRALWALAVQTDPGAPAAPALGPRCP